MVLELEDVAAGEERLSGVRGEDRRIDGRRAQVAVERQADESLGGRAIRAVRS